MRFRFSEYPNRCIKYNIARYLCGISIYRPVIKYTDRSKPTQIIIPYETWNIIIIYLDKGFYIILNNYTFLRWYFVWVYFGLIKFGPFFYNDKHNNVLHNNIIWKYVIINNFLFAVEKTSAVDDIRINIIMIKWFLLSKKKKNKPTPNYWSIFGVIKLWSRIPLMVRGKLFGGTGNNL